MRHYRYLLALLLCTPICVLAQQARLAGTVSLDTGWVRKFYISRIPRFDDMFTASRALIIIEGNLDSAGRFAVNFAVGNDEGLYRLHFIRKGDPPSTLLIGSSDVNHVFFIAKKGDELGFAKSAGKPINQLAISGNNANAELNRLLCLPDTANNNTYITLGSGSASQLAALLAFSRVVRPNGQQREKIQETLSRFNAHSIYGEAIFREYQNNYWKLYITLGLLLIITSLVYGYRFYKQQTVLKMWRELTQREVDITALIISGKSNKQVAQALNIELSTVKTHVNNIYAKLKVSSRKELDRYKNLV